MNSLLKKALMGAGSLVGLAAVGAGGYVWLLMSAFDSSMGKTYDPVFCGALIPDVAGFIRNN